MSLNNTKNLNALILIGGKSSRMGKDKSELIYHRKKQKTHVFDLLKNEINTANIYYSIANTSQKFDTNNNQFILDEIAGLGPFGAIYSAFKKQPKKAWLVIAIDLPFIDKNILKTLINNRDSLKMATTFKGKNKNYLEPLISIWEPKAFAVLKHHLSNKKLSLTNILKTNEVATIKIDDALIENVNTFDGYQRIVEK